jgi:hypothetical protein
MLIVREKKMIKKLFIVLSVFFLMIGCATTNTVKNAKGSGLTRTYSIPFESAWTEMRDIIRTAGLEYVEDNKTERYIIAERGVTSISWGEKVAIFFMPEAQQTTVEIVSKPVLSPPISSAYWTWPGVIFKEMDKRWNK